MRLSIKIIAAAAFAVLLVPAFNLFASGVPKPSTSAAKSEKAADSNVAGVSDPVTPLPSVPEPMASDAAAMPYPRGLRSYTPRTEWFMGYSYLRAMPELTEGNRLVYLNGGSTSLAFNFNRYLGIVGDVGGFNDTRLLLTGVSASVNDQINKGTAFTYMGGPRLSFRNDRITPFVQVLAGGIHASEITISGCTGNCTLLPSANAFALTAGGGLDLRIHRHIALRLIQAEYLMTRFNDLSTGSSATQNDMRLSTGLVFRFGGSAPLPVTLACGASPTSVYPGDTVTVTATAGQLEPNLSAVYSWTGSGVTGNGATANVSTGSLAPGSYTVNCGVKEGKPGKEGLRSWETAVASATFAVKAFEPPTISCSASPGTLNPGDKAVLTAVAVSPQNRPLIYTYSASAGAVSGSGTTASFDSTGAPSGAITATCTVSDDKNQTATSNANLTIEPPPPPPAPPAEQVRLEARLALHSVFFPTDQPRAEHPEGGLLTSQQKTLTTLATDFKSYLNFKSDAHLILTGHADARGSVEYNQKLSERRVARTKQFLVEQGIPEASIDTKADGKEQELTTDQVKDLVGQNPDLSETDRNKVLRDLTIVVLAQNRRVDVTLSTTGQESVRLYPFNAADSLTLLDEKSHAHKRKVAAK